MLRAAHPLGPSHSVLSVAEGLSDPAPVKLVILPCTCPGLSRAGLRYHLESIHGPMVVDESDVSRRFTTYVHHYVRDLPSRDDSILEDRDAVTIIRTPTMADLAMSKSNAAYRDRIGPDEDNFREIEGSVALLAHEIEVAPYADEAPAKLFIFRDAALDLGSGWAEELSKIVADKNLHGAVVNDAKVIEGHFPYAQFDEIGLSKGCDIPELVAVIGAAALAHFGAADTKILLTEPVRFI
jgi:hypothetical protein